MGLGHGLGSELEKQDRHLGDSWKAVGVKDETCVHYGNGKEKVEVDF